MVLVMLAFALSEKEEAMAVNHFAKSHPSRLMDLVTTNAVTVIYES